MFGKCPLCKFNIACLGILNPLCPTDRFWHDQMIHNPIVHPPLNFMFDEIGKLIAIRAKKFDPIIFKRIM